MNPSRVDHIGIAVTNLEEACKVYEALGLTSGGVEVVEEQKVKVAFFPCGDSEIELLESTTPDGQIANFNEKNGGRGGAVTNTRDSRNRKPTLKERGRMCRQKIGFPTSGPLTRRNSSSK